MFTIGLCIFMMALLVPAIVADPLMMLACIAGIVGIFYGIMAIPD